MVRRGIVLVLAVVVALAVVYATRAGQGGPRRALPAGEPAADAGSLVSAEDLQDLGPAPNIAIKTPSGVRRLSDLRGKVVLVDFWGTWCGPCIESIPIVQRTYERFGKQGLEVLGVALEHDDGRQVPRFVKAMHMTYPAGVPVSPAPVKLYVQRNGIPFMALIDRGGTIRWTEGGYNPTIAERLPALVEMLVREPAPPSSASSVEPRSG